MLSEAKTKWMAHAFELAKQSVTRGTGPFGAIIVKEGEIIGRGWNQVTALNDPTAHAEIVAMRAACKQLRSFQLTGCDIYTSCEPCPMCLSAIYWARPRQVYYTNTQEEAAAIGFDDQFIYDEIKLPNEARKWRLERVMLEDPLEAFKLWQSKPDKIRY